MRNKISKEVSKEVLEKGSMLFKTGRARKELETDRRVHFFVQGETEKHSVIYDKEKNEWNCDCRFFSLRQKTCSHIVASRLLLKGEF